MTGGSYSPAIKLAGVRAAAALRARQLSTLTVFQPDVTIAEEGNEFIYTEVGENFAVPIERGHLGLVGDALHFGLRFWVFGEIDLAEVDAVVGEEIDDFATPVTTILDVENRKIDGRAHPS
jgi:xylose isomerase